MSRNNSQGDFIRQAGILAAAGIIVRIIGILYRSPLTSIIGDEGNGYYSTAYNIYTIILLLASYSIPSAISKVIAQKLALKEYRNAHRIFQCAFIYVIVVGGVASVLTYLFAGVLVDENAVPVLRIFAPTIFLSGLLGVFRGYFQAHRTMTQTSFSQILEQLINAIVSILAAWILIHTASSGADATTRAIRGAMGSSVGTGAGVLAALLFMALLYRANSRYIRRKAARDQSQNRMSDRAIFALIFMVVTPFILSTFIYNFSTSLDQTIYIRIMRFVKGLSSAETATRYGIYGGKTMVIINIPIAIAASVSSVMLPTISATYVKGDPDETRGKVSLAVKTTMIVAIPAAVGLAVLAKPVTQLLFPQKDSLELASSLLRTLSVSVVFYSLSTLTNAVLQGIGQVNRPVIHAAIALVIQTVALVPLLLYTNCDLYALVAATIIYSFSMCLLNQLSVRKYLDYKQEITTTFFMPALSSACMGIVAWGGYEAVYSVIHSNVIALALSILLAVIVYFALMIRIGALGRAELLNIPKGTALIRLGEKLHLLAPPAGDSLLQTAQKPSISEARSSESGKRPEEEKGSADESFLEDNWPEE